MKKIVCVDATALSMGNSVALGGIGTYTRDLASVLAHMVIPDISIRFLIYRNGEPKIAADTHLIDSAPEEWTPRQRISHRILIKRELHRETFSLYHSLHRSSAIVSAGQKELLTIHDLFPDRSKENVISQCSFVLYRRAVGRADHLLAVSEYVRDDLMASLGIDRSSISVVHHGIDPLLFHPVNDSGQIGDIRRKYDLPEKIFLFVGTPHKRKNISRLVRSFAALSPAIAESLILLGPAGAHWPPETVKCSRLHILSNVQREDLAAIYSLSTGLVFPSLAEGFGYPVLEAMACGTPVICSQTTALPEVGGDAVCYVDPLDEESLKKALLRVSTDRIYREQLSQAGLQRAKTMTLQRMGSETINVYRKVLEIL